MKIKGLICFVILSIFIIPLAFAAGSGGGGSVKNTPSCTEDTWSCTEWEKCQKSGLQTRKCYLVDDCPNVNTPKPAEAGSCAYVSDMLASLKCHNLATMKERVGCRLGLADADLKKDLQIAYLPEECRALSSDAEKEDCVLLYSKSQQCWSLPIGSSRNNCLIKILDIGDTGKEKQSCKDAACVATLKKKSYALIKFAFYDLEERAEGLYKKGFISKEKAAEIIAKLEEQKIAFNKAASKEQKKQVILETKNLWKEFASSVKNQ